MIPVILIHYHEIALKGKNRAFFENKLIQNIKKTTGIKNITKDFGRIIIEINGKKQKFNQLKQKLLNVFGIANFSLAQKIAKDFKKIKKAALQLIESKKFSSFMVITHRGDKAFTLTSQEINEKLGRAILEKTKAKVDLEKPKIKFFVEISQKSAYLYLKKIKGLGGLPVSTAGKLLCLLSGGIDSPVAAYKMIKRGARVDFIHFHSRPKTNQASIEKAKRLVKLLDCFQFDSRLYLVPFLNFQKQVFSNCHHKFLVILYRRAMFKIAQELALKEKYQGLVTGESLGQVASQTLENMAVVGREIEMPIYRPLVGMDKQEIIDLAKKIGTFQVSIRPHQDCCSLFVPKHPATKAKIESILKEEEKMNMEKLIKEISEKITSEEIKEFR